MNLSVKIVDALRLGALAIEQIAAATGATAGSLLPELNALRDLGLVTRISMSDEVVYGLTGKALDANHLHPSRPAVIEAVPVSMKPGCLVGFATTHGSSFTVATLSKAEALVLMAGLTAAIAARDELLCAVWADLAEAALLPYLTLENP